jgi:hypothetical protein
MRISTSLLWTEAILSQAGESPMNKWLHGNGHWCPTCRGTGRGKPLDMIEYEGGGYCQFYAKCEACNGEKRIAGPGPDVQPAVHSTLSQCIEYGPVIGRRVVG